MYFRKRLKLCNWKKIENNMLYGFTFVVYSAMGNEKSNSYWEAELPPNYDRVGIANFIRAKYVSFLSNNI